MTRERTMTLAALANELGISASTVSRALTRPDLVAEATREKILAAVASHGYQPNAIARSLREGRTRTLGLIVSDLQNPFYSTVAKAVEGTAAAHGFSLVVCNADEDPEKEVRALQLLSEMKVAGIVHASTGANVATLARLREGGLPLVDVDRASGLEGLDAVLVDNVLGARMAAKHLLELGHRDIAMISGPGHLSTGRDRLAGFRHTLLEAGAPLREEYLRVGDFKEESGSTAASDLLDMPDRPSAVFVANNEMMAGALSAIRDRGIGIPEDLSLISFDDVRWARYVEPPLTIIAQPAQRLGALAAELLFERLAGRRKAKVRILEPELVTRGSCAAPRPSAP